MRCIAVGHRLRLRGLQTSLKFEPKLGAEGDVPLGEAQEEGQRLPVPDVVLIFGSHREQNWKLLLNP